MRWESTVSSLQHHRRITDASRDDQRAIIADLAVRGAEGVILGCTEIGLLVAEGDATVGLFDTARIHAEAAADWALMG